MTRFGSTVALALLLQSTLQAQVSSPPQYIQFGWNREADQKFAYIIHIAPAAVDVMIKSGDEVESNMPPELVGLVSRIVVRISSQPPERSNSLEELREIRNQMSKANQRTMPGTAIANLAGSTSEGSIAQIDRDRDAPIQPAINNPTSTPNLNVPPSLQNVNPYNSSTSSNAISEDRQRDSQRSFGAPDSAQRGLGQPATAGLSDPPALPSTSFPSTSSFPSTGSTRTAGDPFSARNPYGSSAEVTGRAPLQSPTGIQPPLDRQRLNPRIDVSNGFDELESPSSLSSNIPASFDQPRSAPVNQPLNVGNAGTTNVAMLPDSVPSQIALSGSPSASDQTVRVPVQAAPTPQRDKLLPILFMLSFVANVYMAILMSRLVTRYRSLLSAFRSGSTSFDGA